MSIPDSTSEGLAKIGCASSTTKISPEDAKDLNGLEVAFRRMRQNISETPYIVTLPCAEPRYHHSDSVLARQWCRDTPFKPDEERLQYSSFLYREHGSDCFVLKTEADEERERNERYLKAYGVSSVQATPSPNLAPKKKITLENYKSRLANGTKKKIDRGQDQARKETSQVNGVKAEAKPSPNTPVVAPITGEKRTRDERNDSPRQITHRASPPPAKKVRRSPQPESKAAPTVQGPSTSTSTPYGLPPLLSPPMVPTAHGLPALLSPTLPANIEADIERSQRAKAKASTPNSTPSSAEKRHNATTNRPASSGVDARKKEDEELLKTTILTRDKKAEVRKGAPLPQIRKVSKPQEPGLKPVRAENAIAHANKKSKEPLEFEDEQASAIVKLKYGRRHSKDIERYLKLPPMKTSNARKEAIRQERATPKPSKQPEIKKETPSKERENMKAPAGKSHPVVNGDHKVRQVEKRPRSDDTSVTSAPPSKKAKGPNALDLKNPRTPVPKDEPSPALCSKNSSAQRPSAKYLTPGKGPVAMMRSTSLDANGTRTPSATSGARSLTPDSQTSSTRTAPTSTVKQHWDHLFNEFCGKGRTLKHQATDLLQQLEKDSDSVKRKKAAIGSIECLITYMTAFNCLDVSGSSLRRRVTTWVTLFPILDQNFRRACRDFPALDSLRLSLGSFLAAHLASLELQAAELDDTEESRKMMREASQHLRRMRDNAADANRKMGVKAFAKAYPKTFDGIAEGEKLDASRKKDDLGMTGGYILPREADCTVMQAARFAAHMIREFASKEGLIVEWGELVAQLDG